MVFMYRIDLTIPPGLAVDLADDGHEMAPGPNETTARLFARTDTDGSQSIFIQGGPFDSEEAARTQAERLMDRLPWIGCRSRLGFALDAGGRPGQDLPRAYRATASIAVTPEGIRVLSVGNGLTIYETDNSDIGPQIVRVEGRVTAKRSPLWFEASLQEAWSAPELANADRVLLAARLHNAAQFEPSMRAQFLLLVTALEVLAERTDRTGRARDLVESFIREAASEQKSEQQALQQLISGLRDLRRSSIGEAIRRMIEVHVSVPVVGVVSQETPAEFATRCYRIRSQLVHEGRADVEPGDEAQTLSELVAGLDWLVWGLLPSLAGVRPQLSASTKDSPNEESERPRPRENEKNG